jgi:hypothetical protein
MADRPANRISAIHPEIRRGLHPLRAGVGAAPERMMDMTQEQQLPLTVKHPTYEIRIDPIAGGKWRSSITLKGDAEPIWTSDPWTVRDHAYLQAVNIIKRGRINGREILPAQRRLFSEPS